MKILIAFGTRPEAIKLAPVIRAFAEDPENFETRVCVTAQHREMLDQVINFFSIKVDYDLNLMVSKQSLPELTRAVLKGIQPVLEDFYPDLVIVQGDTTTSVMVALAAFYQGIKVAHVEAGLRTFNKRAPFPEEINRQLTSRLADIHFAPTVEAMQNLIEENVTDKSIFVTGNTGVDAFLWTVNEVEKRLDVFDEVPERVRNEISIGDKKVLLVTGHRRESLGAGFRNICKSLIELSKREDVMIIYPVHLNPSVQEVVDSMLSGMPNIHLISPLSYPTFVWLMTKAHIILTDSGGIQEEAPYIGKPVLVMRDVTERNELLVSGSGLLVGTNPDVIVQKASQLLEDPQFYKTMSTTSQPFGAGNSAKQIVSIIGKAKIQI